MAQVVPSLLPIVLWLSIHVTALFCLAAHSEIMINLFNRNKDFQEITLEKDGVVLLRFAVTNGFRNIQNLVQKLKRGKSPYDFVEVMACPSGERGLLLDLWSVQLLLPT